MLETSKDLLNILLGFSVALVAIFFSWILFQISRTLKGVNDTIQVVKKIANNIDEGVSAFKSKAGNTAAFLTVFIKSAQSILQTVSNKKTTRRAKTNKK